MYGLLVNGGVKGASDSQPSNSWAPIHKDQARITMVLGRVGILGTASKTSAFGLESFPKDQARITMVVGRVGILGTTWVNCAVTLTLFLFFYLDVVGYRMLLCSRILGKRCCYPNPIPFFIWMLLCSRILGKRCCYPNPIPFFYIWMLLCSRILGKRCRYPNPIPFFLSGCCCVPDVVVQQIPG